MMRVRILLISGRGGLLLLTRCELSKQTLTPEMDTTQRIGIMQRWFVMQHELMPEMRNEVGVLTPKQWRWLVIYTKINKLNSCCKNNTK